jgi:hypothetical protein
MRREPDVQQIIDTIRNILNEKSPSNCEWEAVFESFNDWVVLHCHAHEDSDSLWVCSKLYPEARIADLKLETEYPSTAYYLSGSNNIDHVEPSWGIEESFSNSELPLYFWRSFHGRRKGDEHYYELNQLVLHLLDLHKIEGSQDESYGTLDELGETEKVIQIIKEKDISVIIMNRVKLDKLLDMGDWILARYTKNSRFLKKSPSFGEGEKTDYTLTKFDGLFELYNIENEFFEHYGVQILRTLNTKKPEKLYAKFFIQNTKSGALESLSIDPMSLSNPNYPVFDLTPIFFKAEVLNKYKNNPDKYTLSERTVDCRGAWHLKTYDTTEFHQVHTYAIYLSRLPYNEQLYWKSFNEKPKSGISNRAIQTDIFGEFPQEKSLLESLNEAVGNLERTNIWSPKGGNLEVAATGLHLLNTENQNEWQDFIIALNNVVNEGFKKPNLLTFAKNMGEPDKDLGTLGLLKFILKKSENENIIDKTHKVLQDLQKMRSKGKAHGNWEYPDGSLIEHSQKTLMSVTTAINLLVETITNIKYDA